MSRRISPSLILKASLLAALLATGFVLLRYTPVGEYFSQEKIAELRGDLDALGQRWWAPAALILIYLVSSPLGMPVSVLILAGGIVFGAFWGSLYNLAGLFVGAAASFATARFLGRDVIVHLLGARLRRIEMMLDRHAFWPLVQTRFLPVPYVMINFGAALAGIRPAKFLLATLVGLVPATVLHTYFIATLFDATGRRAVVAAQYVAALITFNLVISVPSIRQQIQRRRRYHALISERRERSREAAQNRLLPLGLVFATLFAGLAMSPRPGYAQVETQAEARPETRTVPRPALDGVEESLRQRLETARAQLDAMLTAQGRPTEELAAAFAEMGLYYDASSLVGAAEICLRNAVTLAPEDFRYLYLLGAFAHRERQLDLAIEHLERALQIRADDVPSLLRLGDVLFLADRLETSRARFARALELEVDLAFAHYGLGRVAAAEENWQGAIDAFEAALAAQPEAKALHQPLGLAYRELGNRDKARFHLEQTGPRPVLFADPLIENLRLTDVASDAWLAIQARQAGNFERAVELYRRLVSNNPDNTSYRQSLAATLFQMGELDAAIEEFGQVLDRAPSNAMAHYRLGQILVQKEIGTDDGSAEKPAAGPSAVLERATGHFRAAIELAPDLKDGHLSLARALARSGQHGEALPHYARTLDLDPLDHGAKRQWARSLAQVGDNALAAAKLREVVAAEPADARAGLDLATVLTRLGDSKAALAQLEALLARDLEPRQKVLATFNAAALHQQTGNDARAIALYQDLVELAPNLRDARFNLGVVLAKQGLFNDAAKELAAAVELAPRDVPARLVLVRVLTSQARWAEAVESLDSGLVLLPGAPALQNTLAQILATCPDAAVRNPERAVELAESTLARRETFEHRLTLATALAAAQRWARAVEVQREVIAAARASNAPQQTLVALEGQLAQYERNLAAGGG